MKEKTTMIMVMMVMMKAMTRKRGWAEGGSWHGASLGSVCELVALTECGITKFSTFFWLSDTYLTCLSKWLVPFQLCESWIQVAKGCLSFLRWSKVQWPSWWKLALLLQVFSFDIVTSLMKSAVMVVQTVLYGTSTKLWTFKPHQSGSFLWRTAEELYASVRCSFSMDDLVSRLPIAPPPLKLWLSPWYQSMAWLSQQTR